MASEQPLTNTMRPQKPTAVLDISNPVSDREYAAHLHTMLGYYIDLAKWLEQSLTASEKRAHDAVETLLDIAAMGKKAGSESAKHRLTELGIDWQTGDPMPNYGSMT